MCARRADLLPLREVVYRKKVRDASSLNEIIKKCEALLLTEGYMDNTGDFTDLIDLERDIELKQVAELLGYCYYLTKKDSQARNVYRLLVLSDDSPFNPWDEDAPFSKVELFYRGLRDNRVRILDLQLTLSRELEKGKLTPLYKELYSLYFMLGYYALATEYLEKYLHEVPADFEHWYLLAEYYEYKENYPQAIRCLENAYKYALSAGYPEEAEGYREKLVELRNSL